MGEARNKMKADSHNKETDPTEKLSMSMNLNKSVKSVTQIEIISDRERQMSGNCEPRGEGKEDRGSYETEIKI